MTHETPVSARAIARQFGLSHDIILEAVHSGDIEAFRLGNRRMLIYPSAVHAWIRSHPVAPEAQQHASAVAKRAAARRTAGGRGR